MEYSCVERDVTGEYFQFFVFFKCFVSHFKQLMKTHGELTGHRGFNLTETKESVRGETMCEKMATTSGYLTCSEARHRLKATEYVY